MNKTDFFDATRLLKVIIVIIPLGLGFLIIGGKVLFTNPNKLFSVKGVFEKYHTGSKYYSGCECYLDTYFIEIKRYKEPVYTQITKEIEILKSHLKKGDQIIVWVDSKKNLEIKQVQLNGEIIIPYNRVIGMSLILTILGLGLLGLSAYALISTYNEKFKNISK
jgi:hypothetical protein